MSDTEDYDRLEPGVVAEVELSGSQAFSGEVERRENGDVWFEGDGVKEHLLTRHVNTIAAYTIRWDDDAQEYTDEQIGAVQSINIIQTDGGRR